MGNSDAVERALRDCAAQSIAAPTSRQISVVQKVLAGGRVRVYGNPAVTKAERTEIMVGGALVVVHKNTNVASGLFAVAARFSEVEVVVREHTHSLRVAPDPRTSGFNPMYLFYDGDTRVGAGYGQKMDLRLASDLLGEYVGGRSDSVPREVVDWIRGKIACAC